MNRLLLIIAFFIIGWTGMTAQTTIEGKVTDKESKEPILFGTIALYRGGVLITGTETDLDGNYFLSDVQPGTYDMEASYVGYATQQVTGIVIKAGRTNKVNFDLSSDAIVISGVEIRAFKVPLIEHDNTTQGNTVTAEKIRALPTKNVNAIAATSAGISSRDGGEISIRGSRANETVYFIDGVRVTGNLIPQSEIEQLQVVTGGIEARYGDVTGGVISLTSRGPSSKVSGSFELEKSVDGFGYNLISGNIAGPILKNKKGQSILGYRFSGQYRNVADNNPSAVGVYRAPEELIRRLEQKPTYNIGTTAFPSLEQIRNDELGPAFKVRPNNDNIDLDLTGRFDVRLSDNIDIQVSGNYNDRVNRFTPSAAWTLLNWVNNPYEYSNTYRGNFRFTHKLGKQGISSSEGDQAASNSNLRNFSYTITLGYQKRTTRREDVRHEDRLFDYGYYGSTLRTWDPIFGLINREVPSLGFGHIGYRENIGEFTLHPTINPILGSYQSLNGVTTNGLRNNVVNTAWSNLYSNVGQVYDRNSKTDDDLYSLNLVTGFDFLPGGSEKGRHNIQFGLLYEQSINRSWSADPFGLWNAAELLANNHINVGLNTSKVVGTQNLVLPDGTVQVVDIYAPSVSDMAIENGKFYRSIRDIKGLQNDEYINVWDIDPSQFRLDMFSSEELILRDLVSYSGFDYLGNKLGSDVRFEDFFTSRDAAGKRSFVVAPQQPIYGAFFLQDKFSYKDIIFRLGLRVDYFDANTKVLRDPYSIYEIETAKDYYTRIGAQQPTSINDDYKVYVASEESNALVAFRDGDQWFLPNGTAVSGGNVIYNGALVFPSYAGRDASGQQLRQNGDVDIQKAGFDPNWSFEDYKPQLNFMPRLAFSFPISEDAGFFAHYDVLYQRPPSNAFASALDYYFFEDLSRINPNGAALNNPNLKPVRTVDYEVGFQQKVAESMALKVSAYYKEMKDLVQQRVFTNVASPLNTYKMFDNLDFGTVKGFSFTLDRRRTNNLEINATYTLQFADGSGSDANSSNGVNNRGPIRNLIPLSFDERHRFTTVIDYRYGSGKAYNGPKIGNLNIFEELGINLTTFLVSGAPYTRNTTPQAFGGSGFAGSINGARLPWNFTADLNIQKRFPVSISGDKENGKKLWFNAYFRVQNVFNTLNVVDLYKFSNDAENDGFLQSSFGQDNIRSVVNTGRDLQAFLDAYAWRMNAPGNFTLPRRMYVGVIVDF